MLSAWQQWCRLCGNIDATESAISVESLGNLNFTIEKHFAISLTGMDNFYMGSVCAECYGFVNKLQKFAEQCGRANEMYSKLMQSSWNQQNDSNHLQTLRYEAGLDEEAKFIVEFDQQGIDNFLFAEVPEAEPIQVNDGAGDPVAFAMAPRKKPKRELPNEIDTLLMDSDYTNHDIDADADAAFDVAAGEQTSDDDTMSSASEEMDVKELKPVRKKAGKGKPKQKPLPRHLKCLLCNIDFDEKRTFDAHMREKHTKEERPFLCAQCPKRYTSLYDLTVHETIHLPEELRNVHPCEFCDKKFRTPELVKSHIRCIHTGDRSFICEECGKDFVNKCSLKEHLMTHNNDYPIQCPYCPKRFKFMARLRIHEEIHKTSTYKCPHCDVELNTKITLRRHMVVHSEQRKYKCQYCGNEYKRAKTLKTHLIIHTGLRPYTCPWCDKTFSHGANCRSHKKKAHPAELAALEASGERLPAVRIPKLRELQPINVAQEHEVLQS